MRNIKKGVNNKRIALTLTKTILAILGDIAVGTVEAFWPHPYYHTFCEHSYKKPSRNEIHKTLYHLKKGGLIKNYKKSGQREFILTSGGRKKTKKLRLLMEFADLLVGPSKNKWDGKWRIIIFDIPERLRKYRDFLRLELTNLNFYPLQKSVWVHPFPIPEDFWREIIDPALRPFVRIAVIESIDREEDLEEYFFSKNR